MIPPRLSFIVSSDLRDPRGSESCLLCFWEPILQKTVQILDCFFVENSGSLQKQTHLLVIYLLFLLLLLLLEYYFKYDAYVLDIYNIYVHASKGKLFWDLKDNSQL